jgi:hypothetical protein
MFRTLSLAVALGMIASVPHLAAQAQTPRQFYRQTGSPLSWSSDDDHVVENLVLRLKIDLRKRNATPTA